MVLYPSGAYLFDTMYFPPSSTRLEKARDVVLVGVLIGVYAVDYAWARATGRTWMAFFPARSGR